MSDYFFNLSDFCSPALYREKQASVQAFGTLMVIGTLTLFAVNLTGTFTGVTLPISALSLLVSAIGGIPGVTLMLGLNLFF